MNWSCLRKIVHTGVAWILYVILTGCASSTAENDLESLVDAHAPTSDRANGGVAAKTPVHIPESPGGGGPSLAKAREDEDDAPDYPPDLSRSIERAHVALDLASADNPKQREFRILLESRGLQALRAYTERTNSDAAAIREAAKTEFDALSVEQRQTLGREAWLTLHEATMRWEFAHASNALEKIARFEADLLEFHTDLRESIGDRGLPANAFALVSPPHLEHVVDSLELRSSALREINALIPDPRSAAWLEFIENRIAELKAISVSDERKAFHASRQQLFEAIDAAEWTHKSESRAARAEQRFQSLRAEAEAASGVREMLSNLRPRGPPASWVMASLREYDLDPYEWLRAQSELGALDAQMLRDGGTPESLKQVDTSSARRLVRALTTSDLHDAARFLSQLASASSANLPSDEIFRQKSDLRAEWDAAIRAELLVRRSSKDPTYRFGRVTMSDANWPVVRDAHFVRWTSVRFPQSATYPQQVRSEVQRISKETVAHYSRAIASHLERYKDIAGRLTLGQEAVPEAEVSNLSVVRRDLAAASRLTLALADSVEEMGVPMPEERRALLVAASLHDPGNDAQSRAERGGFSNRPNEPIQRFQAGIEKQLAQGARGLDEIGQRLDQIGRIAPTQETLALYGVGADKGRLRVAEQLLANQAAGARWNMTPDADATRLPDNQKDWLGRLKEDGKAYEFAEVKSPTTFKALGGGIHFGETAVGKELPDLAAAALVYEPSQGLVLRDAATGREWRIETDVDPTSMRALYRFATLDRNAAISIGWGLEMASAFQRNRQGSSILLDPALVDTPVGRDLVVADTLGWDFGQSPRTRNASPAFGKRFEALRNAHEDERRSMLLAFVDSIPPLETEDPGQFADLLEHQNVSSVYLAAFRFSQFTDDAVNWAVLHRMRSDLIAADSAASTTPDKLVEQWRQLVRPQWREVAEAVPQVRSATATQRESLMQLLMAEREKELRANIRSQLSTLMEHPAKERRKHILFLALESSMQPEGRDNLALAKALVGLLLVAETDREDVADILRAALNPLSLAYLFDDRVEFRLVDGKVLFDADLEYRYVTSVDAFTPSRLGWGKDERGSEVRALTDLTELVRNHEDQIFAANPVLQRMQSYAELTAFLRWAQKAVRENDLGIVDLSALTTLPAADRERYPTPDEILRSN